MQSRIEGIDDKKPAPLYEDDFEILDDTQSSTLDGQ
jgi:hypothetical protein